MKKIIYNNINENTEKIELGPIEGGKLLFNDFNMRNDYDLGDYFYKFIITGNLIDIYVNDISYGLINRIKDKYIIVNLYIDKGPLMINCSNNYTRQLPINIHIKNKINEYSNVIISDYDVNRPSNILSSLEYIDGNLTISGNIKKFNNKIEVTGNFNFLNNPLYTTDNIVNVNYSLRLLLYPLLLLKNFNEGWTSNFLKEITSNYTPNEDEKIIFDLLSNNLVNFETLEIELHKKISYKSTCNQILKICEYIFYTIHGNNKIKIKKDNSNKGIILQTYKKMLITYPDNFSILRLIYFLYEKNPITNNLLLLIKSEIYDEILNIKSINNVYNLNLENKIMNDMFNVIEGEITDRKEKELIYYKVMSIINNSTYIRNKKILFRIVDDINDLFNW